MCFPAHPALISPKSKPFKKVRKMKITVENVNNAIDVMQKLVAWADDQTSSTVLPIMQARRTLADMLGAAPAEPAIEADDNVRVFFRNNNFQQVPDYSAQDPAAVAEV